MNIELTAPALRETLRSDVGRGVTQLAELASRHANNRELVYRAILLKREISSSHEPPSREHVECSLGILDDLIADESAAASSGAETRQTIADAARDRAMQVAVPNAVVLKCAEVSKAYRRGSFALQNVSFEVRYGEIMGIVGRNGNGKTTLFRLLVGELQPDRGTVAFPAILPEAASVRWSHVRQQIAYVPQDLPVWHGSLRSNLHYEAAIHGVRGEANEREVDYIVERLGLGNELDKRWQELAGGFRLRFALARALVWKPKLLILDEPLANLDVFTQQIVLNDLRHLTDSLRYPLAILVSSQHLHEIEEVSDNLLLLVDGNVKYVGAVGGMGATRRENRFELAGNTDLQELEVALTGPEIKSIYYSGVAFVVTTATTMTPQSLLQRLLERSVQINYFRDISRSAKSMLQDDANSQ